MMGQPEGFEYIEKFLSFPQQLTVLKELRGLPYEDEMFHGRLMKREWAQFGYSYKATSRKVDIIRNREPIIGVKSEAYYENRFL